MKFTPSTESSRPSFCTVLYAASILLALLTLYFPSGSHDSELLRTQVVNLYLTVTAVALLLLTRKAFPSGFTTPFAVAGILLVSGNLAPLTRRTAPEVDALVDWIDNIEANHGVPRRHLGSELGIKVRFRYIDTDLQKNLELTSQGAIRGYVRGIYQPYSEGSNGLQITASARIDDKELKERTLPLKLPFIDRSIHQFELTPRDASRLLQTKELLIRYRTTRNDVILDSLYARRIGKSRTRGDELLFNDGTSFPVLADGVAMTLFMFERPDGTPYSLHY